MMGIRIAAYLECLGTIIEASHTDSRHFSVFGKESLESLLKTRKFLTEAFLQTQLAAGINRSLFSRKRTAYTLLSNAPFGSCTSVRRRTFVPSPLTSSSALVRNTSAVHGTPRD